MFCSQCGNSVADGAAVCSRCGAHLTSDASQPGTSAPTAAGAPSAHMPTAQAYNFDAKRWTRNDQIVGGASLVLLISLFLPWFSVSLPLVGSASASGTTTHGWLWIVFILALAILAYLGLTAGFSTLPFTLPVRHEQLLLAATGLNFLLVLIAFVDKPGDSVVKVGWDFGAFIALIAAIVAVAPLVQAMRSRTTQPG
jgi:hypothetical protein